MNTELKPTEIITAPARLSFAHLFEPSHTNRAKTGPLKYQAAILFPPDYDMGPVKACVKAAMLEKWEKLIKLTGRRNPLKPCADRDPDKHLEGYDDGWTSISCKSDYQPTVVDKSLNPIIDKERIYSGCWCRFHINAYAWEHEDGGKGVSFSLDAVQLVREGERLGGRQTMTGEAFGAVEVDDLEPSAHMPDETGGEAGGEGDETGGIFG